MKGRAGGWRERGTFYYLTGARFRGYSLYHDPFQDGRLAQRLERSPHTREVKGSNPLSPTTLLVSHHLAAYPKQRTYWCVQKPIFARPIRELAGRHFVPGSVVLYSGGMQTFLRTIEFLALGLWLGADAFLSFVVAPGAFAILGNRDAAGMMVGFSLARLHFAGIFLGLIFLVARLLRTHSFSSFTAPAALCMVLMVMLAAASQFTVSNRMANLKKDMVSVQNTPENDPRRVEFNHLHHTSVRYEGAVLLLSLAAMYLLVREVSIKS